MVILASILEKNNIFDLRLNKRWSEQLMRWFETPASSLWRRGNGKLVSLTISLHNPIRRILACLASSTKKEGVAGGCLLFGIQ